MAFKFALVGSTMAVVGYTTYKYMIKPNPSIFVEKPFYEEALILARGYKPITEKLVEPIQPLKIDTSNDFNVLTLLGAQVQIPIRGAQRSGVLYCYATRDSLDDEWHVDKLEFKANNQPNRYPFYDRSLRRVPTPSEQALIDYKKELEAKIAKDSLTISSTPAPVFNKNMLDDDSMSDDDDDGLDIPDNTKHIVSIQLGQVDIDCWFHSPYINIDEGSNEKNHTIEKLFICEYCLRYFLNNKKYREHINECTCRHPPGRKIYDDPNGLSIYEVDGTTSELYCQCLCLLAKLFLERKTIYFDVTPFLFYILVESDKRMKNVQHIIGYFSKEKSSDELYNLACLMVLPHRQRQGFGRFLISLSYELTKLEKKTGSPEKPLSALGQMTYKSYWHSTILTKLEEYRRLQIHPTLTKLSIDTGICINDVIQTLIDLRLAHTGISTIDIRDQRNRRYQKSDIDDNNNSNSILTIDEDLLHSHLIRLSNGNLLSKSDQHSFLPKYLRLNNRR